MTIRVLLFAHLRELLGKDCLEVNLPPGATLKDLWRHLQEENPVLNSYSHPPLMARNMEYVASETVLQGGEEIALIPPVSGG